jgi:Flp pilus assembly pilin Flp
MTAAMLGEQLLVNRVEYGVCAYFTSTVLIITP